MVPVYSVYGATAGIPMLLTFFHLDLGELYDMDK